MAFDRTKLAAGSAQNTTIPRAFAYETDDASGDLQTAGYFDGAADVLNVGDRIEAKANGTSGYLVVVSNAAGVVDCSDFVPYTTTDSD